MPGLEMLVVLCFENKVCLVEATGRLPQLVVMGGKVIPNEREESCLLILEGIRFLSRLRFFEMTS